MDTVSAIKIFGDQLKIRKTYDIDDFGMGYYGFEVCNENDEFLCHFIGENIDKLKQFIRTAFSLPFAAIMFYYRRVGNMIHHIVLTVSDVKVSTDFYRRLLGWKIRNSARDFTEFTAPDDPEGKRFLFVIGLPRDQKRPKSVFDRNNIGLDRFAFSVENMSGLKLIERRLKRLKIPMEESGIVGDGFGGTAIFSTDPDGMKIEFHLKK